MLKKHTQYFQFINTSDIAYFYLENKQVFVMTKDGRQHFLNYTLENIGSLLDPDQFFRVNRQFIVHLDVIGKIYYTDNKGRLMIDVSPKHKDEVHVSIERTTSFKNWLNK